ncbi:hypothetical protein EJ06DRAFT_555371 [Trichodelitschia bisporula]|uniref:Uncharacterized protein n=1 Tax=Trichodelitschia bisporula TaxID=703511 RepID=A0A6G1I0R8_9PEZI|nr:hypothetical protein EJ06DRAFT_555371 [Trichodelitschia bisporula]
MYRPVPSDNSNISLSQLKGPLAPDITEQPSRPITPAPRRNHARPWASIWHTAVPISLTIIPLIAFIVWLAISSRKNGEISSLSGTIGGRLTQTQAKAVDFICGAVLAPATVLLLNFYWFGNTLVTAVNEKGSAVPLVTLVEASMTDSGSYSVLKLFNLVRSKTPRMLSLAALVLLSALTKTAFSNFIAYEAYTDASIASTAKLRALNMPFRLSPLAGLSTNPYNYTRTQWLNFGSQAVGMLNDVAYYSAADKLVDDTYVGINATQAALNSLPPEVVALQDVPGYRLSVDCRAVPPDTLGVTQMGGFRVAISAILDDGTLYIGDFPGQATVLTNSYNDNYSFIGFNGKTSAYLGYMTSFNLTRTNRTEDSPYGKITFKAYNMTGQGKTDTGTGGFSGTKTVMSSWGFRCQVFRQAGAHNLRRNPDLTWRLAGSTWPSSEAKVLHPLLLADWQTSLNYRAPGSFDSATSQPGLAPAFFQGARICPKDADTPTGCPSSVVDYKLNVLNFLYAAGEMERIALEVLNANLTSNDGQFQVAGQRSTLFYRITYVPAILIVGLLSTFLAGVITLGFTFVSWRTVGFRLWRPVDSLRVIIDSAHSFRDDPTVQEMSGADTETLEEWATKFHVKYQAQSSSEAAPLRLVALDGKS